MSLFDSSKKRKRGEPQLDSDWDLPLDTEETVGEGEEEEDEEEEDEDMGVDNLEGWIDERVNMSQSDNADTAVAVEPVRHVLTKVSSLSQLIVCSNSAYLSASSNLTQNQELDHDFAPRLVRDTRQTHSETSDDPTRRFDSMEFYL
jgi:hypothetical protein